MENLTDKLVLLYSAEQIKNRISEISLVIFKKYKNKNPLFISVLNGSFIFLADLIRSLSIKCEIDFVQVRSYNGVNSSGNPNLIKDLSMDIKNRDIILVEDIIDTGSTIKFLHNWILGHRPKSISIASFLFKPNKVKFNFPIEFIGFEIPREFVVGYGLDFNQELRHLDSLYYFKNDSKK